MTRVALDSNILIYAEFEPETDKGRRCIDLIVRAGHDGVIPQQAFGELLRFTQRKYPKLVSQAVATVKLYRTIFLAPIATEAILNDVMSQIQHDNMQYWDAIICVCAREAGAEIILSEDMQDGRMLGCLQILNPFNPANDRKIDAALGD